MTSDPRGAEGGGGASGEDLRKVANGIRLTGIPGFSQSLFSIQMWQASLMLANAGKLGNNT